MHIKDLAVSKRILRFKREVSLLSIRKAIILCDIQLADIQICQAEHDGILGKIIYSYPMRDVLRDRIRHMSVMSYGIRHTMRINRVGRYVNLLKPRRGFRLVNFYKLPTDGYYTNNDALRYNKYKMLDDLRLISNLTEEDPHHVL